jgi:hypothetical protein
MKKFFLVSLLALLSISFAQEFSQPTWKPWYGLQQPIANRFVTDVAARMSAIPSCPFTLWRPHYFCARYMGTVDGFLREWDYHAQNVAKSLGIQYYTVIPWKRFEGIKRNSMTFGLNNEPWYNMTLDDDLLVIITD